VRAGGITREFGYEQVLRNRDDRSHHRQRSRTGIRVPRADGHLHDDVFPGRVPVHHAVQVIAMQQSIILGIAYPERMTAVRECKGLYDMLTLTIGALEFRIQLRPGEFPEIAPAAPECV